MTEAETDSGDEQARALFAAENYAGAEILFRAAAAKTPTDAAAHYNLGVTLAKMERFEEAIACYRVSIDLNPDFAPAYTNVGFCLNGLNLVAQARHAFRLARNLAPGDTLAILNEGIAALALGDYAAGWADFTARWHLPAYAKFKRDFAQPMWRGENISGQRLFIYAEQGFGDSLQMARFIPELEARGASVIVEAPPALAVLLRSISTTAHILAKGDPVPAFDIYCAMMDVPGAMGVTLDNLPARTPYLFADEAAILHYQNKMRPERKRIGSRIGPRIGLSWAGRASHENDRNRSLTLAQCAPLLANADDEWISLQRVMSDEDKAALPTTKLIDWGNGFTDFAATAAAIMALDLVITVDTAIAHLAGALGKPVWILLPFHADWRWLTEREDSPWYPSARLFRQRRRGDWGEVIERIGQQLRKDRSFLP